MKPLSRHLIAALAFSSPAYAATKVFQTFDGDGFDDWKVEGNAFGVAPAVGKTDAMEGEFKNYAGEYLAISAHGGDSAKGSLTSPEITIVEPYITFLIAGGNHAGKTAAQLLVDGKVVRETTGRNDLDMRPALWDVSEFKGKKVKIRLIDDESGKWGMIGVDHFIFTDYPNQKFPGTTRKGIAYAPGLVPDPNLPGVTIPPDVKLSIVADSKNQNVISPTALAVDEKNNVFISETHRFRFGVVDDRDHLYWYLDDLASKKPADRRALHEKWNDKVSVKSLTEKSEVVRTLSSPDAAGVYQKSTAYAEDFKDLLDGTAAGVFSFEGTTYFACIPKIWMLRDTNGDGLADNRKVVEEGFGIRISLSGHDMNGFALGPDGRIYGTIGDRGFNFTTKEGKKLEYPDEGAVFRFDPDGTNFELMHTGLRNPKEIAFDEFGNAFSVDNNSDQGDSARVVYIVEGGDSGWQMEHQAMHTFHRQIGLATRPPSRWMNEKMWEVENDIQPAYILPPSAYLTSGPSGLTYHPGTGFLESQAGHFLVTDYRGSGSNSGIWSFEMKPKLAGMEMTSSDKFNWGVGATDVEYSWDGKLLISDFVTGWTSHADGRILSMDAGEKTYRAEEAADAGKIAKEGFPQRSSADLAKLLQHADSRIRLRAQIELTRKPDGFEYFSKAVASANALERVHGAWGLGILARRGPVPSPATDRFSKPAAMESRKAAAEKLVSLLDDKDAEFRAQVLRSLFDAPVSGDAIPLVKLLKDESPRVRFFAATAIGKLKAAKAFEPVCEMLAENANKDVYLRHAGIYALEHMGVGAEKIAALSSHKSAAVRLAATVTLRRLKSPDVAAFVPDADPKVSDEAVRAIYDNVIEDKRPVAAALLDNVHSREWTDFMLRRLLHNSFRIGDEKNLQRVLRIALDEKIPTEVREEALRLVSLWAEPFPADQLTGHWRPLEKRPLDTIVPSLNKVLPLLLQKDGFVLTAALGLMEQYKLDTKSLDEPTLRAIVENGKLPADARAKALDLLVERKPAEFDAFLVKIAADPATEVALSALKNLAARDPKAALIPIETAIDSKNTALAQKSWSLLAEIPGAEADEFIVKHLASLQAATGISPSALELIEAAKARKAPAVATAVAALEKALAENSDPLAKWNVALEGGDAKAGASMFSSNPAGQCMRCHRAEDGHSTGGEAGPNLDGIGKKHDRRYLLESIVHPSAQIAPGYGATLLTFNNGATLGGNLLEETPEHIDVNAAGKNVRVKRSDIKEFTQPVSAMPPMEYLLKPNEIRDLVAWLESLQKPAKDSHAPAAPTPFDPNTLLKK